MLFHMRLNNFQKGLIIVSAAFFILLFSLSSFAQEINTGDSTSKTVIENVVNTNIVKCCTPTPSKKQEEPTPTVEQPTPSKVPPTPTNPPPTGGNGGGGQGGPPSEPQKQGEVLGAEVLAAAGNFPSDLATIQQVLGLTLLATGLSYGVLRKNNS